MTHCGLIVQRVPNFTPFIWFTTRVYSRLMLPSRIPCSLHFALRPALWHRFWVEGHFETCTQWPWNDLKTLIGQRYPIYILQVCQSPKLHSVCSTASCFWVTSHFEKSGLNDPKMTLNTFLGSKVSHMSSTSSSEHKISMSFTLWPTVIELLFEKSALIYPKRTLYTYKRKGTPYMA